MTLQQQTLPCSNTTGDCSCTANMGSIPVNINSPNFTLSQIYECGYFVGLNSDSSNGTVFTTLNIVDPENKGFNCGKGESTIYMNSTEYNLQDMYDCGYSAGRKWEKSLGNSSNKNFVFNKKTFFALLVLLFVQLF